MTDTALDHGGLLPMRERHPGWIWNRSDNHVFLSEPGSPEAFKTVVEPGNSYSPGFRSYGVSVWLTAGGRLWAPELQSIDQLHWRYADGYLPLLECRWQAEDLSVRTTLCMEGDLDRRDFRVHLSVSVLNDGLLVEDVTAHVVIRSFGAAGAPITSLGFAGRDVLLGDAVMMSFDTTPDLAGAVSYAATGTDVGEVLRDGGATPAGAAVDDPSGWASGAASFRRSLESGASLCFRAVNYVHAGSQHLSWLRREPGTPVADFDEQGFLGRWRSSLPMRLDLPDNRYAEALQAQAVYLAMASSADEPRIAPISYPLWWLRDGAYCVTALGKAGLAGWVDRAVRSVARREPFGGFGSEGDGPGQLIWLMSEHYLMTGDDDFLAEVFPHIRRNADLIVAMRTTGAPIFGRTEIRTPQMMFDPAADLMCRPAVDGLITGRMDGHFPRFWVNGWSWFGLRRAVAAAEHLGKDASGWCCEADLLLAAIRQEMPRHFGENDRDLTGSIWPTGYADPADPVVRRTFEQFWNTVRFKDGIHHPEPEWTYFEAGQAHNWMLLGEREHAWVSIEHFLTNSTAPGLYTQHEGIGDENSSLQWQRSRGWDRIPHVTPHGWTAAELLLLLRDGLLRETVDGDLVIGSGIPESWLATDFSFTGMPSHFGSVDVEWRSAQRTLHVTTQRPVPGMIRTDFGIPARITASPRT